MSAKTKIGETWRGVVAPYVKVSGAWKVAESAWVKVNGQWKSWFLQGGLLDVAFANNIGTGPNSRIFGGSNSLRVVLQPDGKILVGGSFTEFNGVASGRLIRLNSDGTTDTQFNSNIGTGANTVIAIIRLQEDGKIILIGNSFADSFSEFNGVAVPGLVRLNSDGTIDTTFLTNIGTGIGITSFTNAIRNVIEQPDRKLLLAGSFSSFNGGSSRRIIRLNADGTRDTSFSSGTGFGGLVSSTIIQPDGKFIIEGNFSSYNNVSSARLIRLNADGTRDTGFSSNIGSAYGTNSVSNMYLHSDGKIYLNGNFTEFNGVAVPRLVRLNSNGTIDTEFLTNIGTGPNSASFIQILEHQENKMLLSNGTMTNFNGVTIKGLVRLNSNGTIDSEFLTNIGTGPNAFISSTRVQTELNNKIIVFGGFTQFNGYVSRYIARLNSNGTLDVPFTTNLPLFNFSPDSVSLQQDGKMLNTTASTNIGGTSSKFLARIGGAIAY
jgi:uncharacterized delta-60 repeat protein